MTRRSLFQAMAGIVAGTVLAKLPLAGRPASIVQPWARVVTWIGGDTGDWSDPRCWSTGCVPRPGDDVLIESGTLDASNQSDITLNSLTIRGGSVIMTAQINKIYVGNWSLDRPRAKLDLGMSMARIQENDDGAAISAKRSVGGSS